MLTPVLVNEDTIYSRERIDHAARIVEYGRPKVIPVGSFPLMFQLQVPRPSPSLFEDRFAGVFPVLDYVVLNSSPSFQQPFIISFRPSTRLDDPDPESGFHRVDQGTLFSFIKGLASPAFVAHLFEIPDLNGPEWVDWVHPPPTPESQLFPFRQLYAQAAQAPTPFLQLFYQAPNFRIEAEIDARPPDLAGLFLPFRQIPVVQTITLIRVRAMVAGQYGEIFRDVGDVFDINLKDLSNAAQEIVALGDPDYPIYGWMQIVSSNTPLYSWALSNGGASSPRTSPRRTVF